MEELEGRLQVEAAAAKARLEAELAAQAAARFAALPKYVPATLCPEDSGCSYCAFMRAGTL